MKGHLYLLFTLLFLTTTKNQAQQVSYTIDFNTYTPGNLNGKDGWKTFKEWNGAGDYQIADVVGFTAADGTQAAFHPHGGPGVGRVATRKATPNFNFSFQNGGLRTLEYDVHSCWWGQWACIGFDKNLNGKMTPNQSNIEPNEGGLLIATGGYDFPNSHSIQLPNGVKHYFSLPATTVESWIRLRITIDLDANSKQGSLSMSVKDSISTATPTDWQPVAGAQGINLELTPGSGDKNDPEKWDALSFQIQGATGAFDNITFSQPDASFQYISFTAIPDKLTVNQPFQLSAVASSGLPVSFSIVAGPATVSGNTITLTGQKGIVTVRASQAGNGAYAPADDVENSFEVVDAAEFPPALDIRNPVNGAVVPITGALSPMLLSAYSTVLHADVLSIGKVEFVMENETIVAEDHGNGHFTAWWTPPGYGNRQMTVKTYNSQGFVTSAVSNFEIVQSAGDQQVTTLDKVHLLSGNGVKDTFYVLPAHVGAYDKITGTLKIECPPGGCDPWDRVSSIKVKDHNGTWVEIIRYITPYGVGCTHTIDLTDFFPILQGKVEIRAELGTFANGFLYTLNLDYHAGTPAHRYGHVDVLWNGNYPFGDMANLQPCETYLVKYPVNAKTSTLKLVSTGHSWGDNNTGNAAEFHEDTHHIKVDGANAFDQHNWWDCNPNPQGCQPQNGTWYFDRAGWCPGTIAQWYNFNMTPHINLGSPIEMRYIFDEDYVDLCSPSNPNCVTGVTCPNCTDPEANPQLVVWANLITFSDSPNEGISGTNDLPQVPENAVFVLPNPSEGVFQLHFRQDFHATHAMIANATGQMVFSKNWSAKSAGDIEAVDLGDAPAGLYFLTLQSDAGILVKKLVLR